MKSILDYYMKQIFYILLILTLTTSCKQRYEIKGNATLIGLEGKKLFLRTLQKNQWVNIDSTDIVHCEFMMKGNVDSTVMAALFLDNQNIMPIVLEKGNIKVNIDHSEITAYGTMLNNALYEYIYRKNEIELEYEELNKNRALRIFEGRRTRSSQRDLMDQFDRLELKMQRLTDSFIQRNYDNVLGPNLFMMSYGNTNYPLLTPEIKEIMEKAPERFKNNYHVKYFISKARENMRRQNQKNSPLSIEHNALWQ